MSFRRPRPRPAVYGSHRRWTHCANLQILTHLGLGGLLHLSVWLLRKCTGVATKDHCTYSTFRPCMLVPVKQFNDLVQRVQRVDPFRDEVHLFAHPLHAVQTSKHQPTLIVEHKERPALTLGRVVLSPGGCHVCRHWPRLESCQRCFMSIFDCCKPRAARHEVPSASLPRFSLSD